MTVLPTNEEAPRDPGTTDQDAEALADAVQQACGPTLAEDSAADPSDWATELATERDRVLRLQAEMENLRSRTAREINEERRYAPLAIVRGLLPVVDNIDRAIEAAEQTGDAGSLLEGFKLVRQQLMTVLEQHHCKPIPSVGQPFDPQVHEAILQQPSDEQPANHVLIETQAGYQMHDRVVRASQVIISTGPAES
jgi:molecular chaperone GrpE